MSREIENYFPSHLYLLQKCCNLLIKFTLHFIFDIISQRDKNKKSARPLRLTRDRVIEFFGGSSIGNTALAFNKVQEQFWNKNNEVYL